MDGRGKHGNVANKLPEQTKEMIRQHIKSFRGERSHYSLGKSKRLYLPAELNQTKMFELFKEKHPDIKVSQETYRQIFINEFNISFGYPRSDTCSTCDENRAIVEQLKLVLKDDQDNEDVKEQLSKAETENKVHLARAKQFYNHKRNARRSAEVDDSIMAICMDFQKNLPAPNITTNDVYYRRQLTCISFNIHELASNKSHFYVYDETIAKKGSDDVCSMIQHFISNSVADNVKHLKIFCDSCAGQNKNYTVFRYLHHLVHVKRRFDEVLVTFPVRGHSFMECDKQFGLINQKTPAETPNDWWNEIRRCRKKPCPYNVIELQQSEFSNWGEYLKNLYVATCPFPTRPVRVLSFAQAKPRFAMIKEAYGGSYKSCVITKKKGQSKIPCEIGHLYAAPIPLPPKKHADVTHLAKFLKPYAKEFYASLPTDSSTADADSE